MVKNKMNSKTVINKTNFVSRFLIKRINGLTKIIENYRIELQARNRRNTNCSFDSGYEWALAELEKGNSEMVESMAYNPFNKSGRETAFDNGILKAMREYNRGQ